MHSSRYLTNKQDFTHVKYIFGIVKIKKKSFIMQDIVF